MRPARAPSRAPSKPASTATVKAAIPDSAWRRRSTLGRQRLAAGLALDLEGIGAAAVTSARASVQLPVHFWAVGAAPATIGSSLPSGTGSPEPPAAAMHAGKHAQADLLGRPARAVGGRCGRRRTRCTSTMRDRLGAESSAMHSSAPRARCSRRALRASISPVRPRALEGRTRRAQPRALEGRRRVARILDPGDAASLQRCAQTRLGRVEQRAGDPTAAVQPTHTAGRSAPWRRPSRPLPRASRISSVSAWSSWVCAGEEHGDAVGARVVGHQPIARRAGGGLQAGVRLVAFPHEGGVAETERGCVTGDGRRLDGRLRTQAVIDSEDGMGGRDRCPAAASSPPTAPSAPCCRCRRTPPARLQRQSARSRG